MDKLLVESFPDGVIVLDENQCVQMMNRPMLDLLGVSLKESQNQPLSQVIPDIPYQSLAGKSKETHEAEVEIGEQIFWLRDVPYDKKGRLLIFQNVTQQVLQARRLQVEQARYATLFEKTNDAILIYGTDRIVQMANPRAAEMLGYSLDELIGMSKDTFAEAQNVDASLVHKTKLVKGKDVPTFEQTYIRKDGSKIPVEISMVLVQDDQGEASYFQNIVRDISERKEVEIELNERVEQLNILRQVDEEVSSTLHVSTVSSIALDAALRLSYATAGFIALKEDEGLRVVQAFGNYKRVQYGEILDTSSGILHRAVVNQRPELILDVSTDPDYVPDLPDTVALMAVPLISRDTVIGIMNLETKKTEHFDNDSFNFVQILSNRIALALDNATLHNDVKNQLEELQQLYQQVSQLEQLKTDMIRIASHDLRNPVHVMRGYLEMLRIDEDEKLAPYRDYLANMRYAVKRMDKMLRDILSLERIEQMAQQNDGEGETFDFVEQVEVAFQEYETQAIYRKQTFILETNNLSNVRAMGDVAQIYEAMTNLISNALKYTPEGGRVTIKLSVDENQLAFEVEDTGFGIPIEMQARLFQPFFRAKTKETRDIEGTGLGLHLVQNIIERHSGKMIFRSTYGKGSTFGFHLPIIGEAVYKTGEKKRA